ncbi:MarR family transcriptional regulator [Candidatus Micrarchaeota archaeon]|nr:MarR family transcriptional regulator [Candidatus Micrarchaeota archaeon]
MKNRNVGLIIIGIAALVGFIVFSFHQSLNAVVSASCSHGDLCPMWGAIEFQTNISIIVIIILTVVGLYLIFFGEEEKIITKIKRIKSAPKQKNITKEYMLKNLGEDEKQIFEKIIESEGSIFQSDLVDKTKFTKVKVSRILDKLEGKGIIERKRRGMTNVVILKH